MNVLQLCDPTLNIFLNISSRFLLLISSHSKVNRFKAVSFPYHMFSKTFWTDNDNAYTFYFITRYQNVLCFSGNRGRRSSEKVWARWFFFFPWVVLSPVLFQSSQEGWHLGCEDFFNPLAHQCDLDEWLLNLNLCNVDYCKRRSSCSSCKCHSAFKGPWP